MTYGPPAPLTEEDLLAALRRNLDSDFLEPALADPNGAALFAAIIAPFLRVAEAFDENFGRGAFIRTAHLAAPATTTLRISRPTAAAAGTIAAGFRLRDDRGIDWIVSSNVEVLAPDTEAILPLETLRRGYFLNTLDPLALAFLDTPFDEDLVPDATSVTPAAGGRSSFLELLGAARKTPLQAGESEEDYQLRLATITDVVSPDAMITAALAVLARYTPTRRAADLATRFGARLVLEPNPDPTASFEQALGHRRCFFADHHFADDPHGPVVKSIGESSGWFDVVLPQLPEEDDPRLFADVGFADDPLEGYADGWPAVLGPVASVAVAALVDELWRRRAGGVRFKLEVGVPLGLVRNGDVLVDDGDWSAVGGADVLAALALWDGDETYGASILGAGNGAAAAAGDVVLSAAAPSPAPLTVEYVRVSARARRATTSTGVNPQLAFVVGPTGGALKRALVDRFPVVIDHDDWRTYECILEQNPSTALPWTVSDAGLFRVGAANAAAVGATDELRIANLLLELVVTY